MMVLKADETGDLEEVERGETVSELKWLSGSLYEDSNDVLRLESGDEEDDEAGNVLMFLLAAGGGLQVSILFTTWMLGCKSNALWLHRYSVFQIYKSRSTLPPALAFFHHSYQQGSPSVVHLPKTR